MKRYKLLKDLPNLKKGTILSEADSIFGIKILTVKDNSVGTIFIGNELFEEIQEEPTDSIHWKPQSGDTYWYLSNMGDVLKKRWMSSPDDIRRHRIGNTYRTENECEKARDRELAEARLRRTSTFKPDFYNGMFAYTVGYDCKHKRLYVTKLVDVIIGNPITYESLEDAEKSIKEHKEDWLTYFGIKEEE
jgi:hypothetical protein|nr:MAG TPA: hypothetical protein [Caudoviricetes sp.]